MGAEGNHEFISQEEAEGHSRYAEASAIEVEDMDWTTRPEPKDLPKDPEDDTPEMVWAPKADVNFLTEQGRQHPEDITPQRAAELDAEAKRLYEEGLAKEAANSESEDNQAAA